MSQRGHRAQLAGGQPGVRRELLLWFRGPKWSSGHRVSTPTSHITFVWLAAFIQRGSCGTCCASLCHLQLCSFCTTGIQQRSVTSGPDRGLAGAAAGPPLADVVKKHDHSSSMQHLITNVSTLPCCTLFIMSGTLTVLGLSAAVVSCRWGCLCRVALLAAARQPEAAAGGAHTAAAPAAPEAAQGISRARTR